MRKFTEDSPITYCFGSKTSPMIKVDSKRNVSEYQSEKEKIEAFKTRKKSDKFFIAWSGAWKTDVFEVSEDDIKFVLNKIN